MLKGLYGEKSPPRFGVLGRCLSKIYDLPVVERLTLIALSNVATTVFGTIKRVAYEAHHFDTKNKNKYERKSCETNMCLGEE